MATAVVAIVVAVVRTARERWQLSRINAARQQAWSAHTHICRGLQTMASIVPGLGKLSLDLSARAMELLDHESALLIALRRARKAPRRERGALLKPLREIAALEQAYADFQRAVLSAVYEQTAGRVDAAPVPTYGYRAVFKVLEHRLPARLWPAMNRILAREVRLLVRSAGGEWHPARKIGVRYGGELVFSRKNLERAIELRLIVGGTVVSEFAVEHGVKDGHCHKW